MFLQKSKKRLSYLLLGVQAVQAVQLVERRTSFGTLWLLYSWFYRHYNPRIQILLITEGRAFFITKLVLLLLAIAWYYVITAMTNAANAMTKFSSYLASLTKPLSALPSFQLVQEVPDETCNLVPRRLCTPVTRVVPSLVPSRYGPLQGGPWDGAGDLSLAWVERI